LEVTEVSVVDEDALEILVCVPDEAHYLPQLQNLSIPVYVDRHPSLLREVITSRWLTKYTSQSPPASLETLEVTLHAAHQGQWATSLTNQMIIFLDDAQERLAYATVKWEVK
jgi:hypothetical protein